MENMQKILCAILAVLLLCSCGGQSGRKHGEQSSPQSDAATATVPVAAATLPKPTVNVYMENSGSMDGYVKGVTMFEQAVYSYLSDIKISDFTNTLNLFYINSKIIPLLT
ncbi:MAG: hypothetical protein LBL94_08165 [Prevotellaceae bacterium]|nr:hypothetical protein [Prevotellaceae bacterium]